MSIKQGLLVVAGIAAFGVYNSAYIVDQREQAIKFRFKEIVETNIQPGLHFKMPFADNIRTFSSQILTLDARPERFLTGEKKYVTVDFFVKWRISNIDTYYRSTRGGTIEVAQNRLEVIMKDGLRNEFSKRTIEEAISGQRGEIMQGLQEKSNEVAQKLGIEVVDVRVSKIDFPESVSESVFNRMRSERERVAQDFRSRGKEKAEKIKATADREAIVIKANAYRDSEKLRGEGDAKAADIYAKAFNQDQEFYSFYRSLGAYEKTLGKEDNVMVLEPDSEFFRYFKQQQGSN